MSNLIKMVTNLFTGNVFNLAGQIFMSGLLGTVWFFINNMVKTMQKNIIEVVTARIAA